MSGFTDDHFKLLNLQEIEQREKEIEQALMNSHEEYARRLVILHKELSEICGIDVNKI